MELYKRLLQHHTSYMAGMAGFRYLLKMDICDQRVNLEFQCLKTKGNVFAIISHEFM